ncbi:MAG: hypothetical protein ACRECV_19470 [Xanthobacteraceae bacterium]
MIEKEAVDAPASSSITEIAAFLTAVAAVLREAVVRFEETTARITERVAGHPARDRELVVTLQDFDRLQQEFVALAEVLGRSAAKSRDSWSRTPGDRHPAEDAIAAVSIADIKERLLRQLTFLSTLDLSIVPTGDEAVF